MELSSFVFFAIIGFVAQMINGSLGMAYGTLSMTLLLMTGLPPLTASSSVHLSKVVNSGISGLAHWRFGNVDKTLLLWLGLTGAVGGVGGVVVATTLPGDWLTPLMAGYLLLMGIRIVFSAAGRKLRPRKEHIPSGGIGLLGGLVDAMGGAGWGPVVTSTLMAHDKDPRCVIGSVSMAESIVALAISMGWLLRTQSLVFNPGVALGLIVGGGLAAPFAAYLTRFLPARGLMGTVGVLVIGLSSILLWSVLAG